MKFDEICVKACINFFFSIDKAEIQVYDVNVKPVRYFGKACMSGMDPIILGRYKTGSIN